MDPSPISSLSLSELTKSYHVGWRRPPVSVLRGINLSLGEGEAFGYLGANGAGKTTTIKILVGLIRPTSGMARIWGIPAGQPLSRRGMGYVPEEASLPGGLTPRELLDYGARINRLAPSMRRRRTDDILDRLNIAPFSGIRVRRLSKGQRQRTALALAMIGKPRLLLLDEPLTGLDAPGRWEVIEFLQELRGQGTTIFLSSHVLPDVERLCDRVGILCDGEMVAEGTPASLARKLGITDASLEEVFLRTIKGRGIRPPSPLRDGTEVVSKEKRRELLRV